MQMPRCPRGPTGRTRLDLVGLCALLPVLLVAAETSAHPLAPALLELVERASADESASATPTPDTGAPEAAASAPALPDSDAGAPTTPDSRAPVTVDVRWKTSSLRVPGSNIQPVLPAHCQPVGSPTLEPGPASLTTRWRLACGVAGLTGARVGVEGLDRARISTLLRVELVDGRSFQRVLRADDPFTTIPARESVAAVLTSYGVLGVEHILTGFDHLLFVFGLLLLVGGGRPLVATVTAFTAGHSVTLSLAVLGVVSFPTGLIELCIAISVLLLALELARDHDRPPTALRRWPWLMALVFGLLHGLGFAGALAEVGLPQADIPVALLSFNVGIELGQLAFLAVVLVSHRLFRRLLERLPRWVEQVPIYALGSLSAFWCIERSAALLQP